MKRQKIKIKIQQLPSFYMYIFIVFFFILVFFLTCYSRFGSIKKHAKCLDIYSRLVNTLYKRENHTNFYDAFASFYWTQPCRRQMVWAFKKKIIINVNNNNSNNNIITYKKNILYIQKIVIKSVGGHFF